MQPLQISLQPVMTDRRHSYPRETVEDVGEVAQLHPDSGAPSGSDPLHAKRAFRASDHPLFSAEDPAQHDHPFFHFQL